MKIFWITLSLAASVSTHAADLDIIGVTLLRQFDPGLQGAGVKVAQVEAPADASSPPVFEVIPDVINQPVSLFTFISSLGTATTYPNSVGVGSGHAFNVSESFYGLTNGAAPQVNHVDNYEANYFFNNIINAGSPPAIQARVVNQSFIFDPQFETLVNDAYDDYAANNNTIFVNGVGNGGQVASPGTSYNGIGVGIYTSPSAVGPSTDGRCKPDITAPDLADAPFGANSYSIPYVAGAATILVQAANRGDGGANTAASGDSRTIKALLLNGAIKLPDWTNSITSPLDLRYGAGVANVFNSWKQLRGGKQPPIESTTVTPSGNPHPPGANAGNEPVLTGWDFNGITNSASQDKIRHYYFNLPGTDSYTLTATLVWNRKAGNADINDLNLFLYRMSNTNLTASSVSTVDNVEHLYLPQLAPGRYDLQVLKKGSGQVSTGQTYALAFEFFNLSLQIAPTNDNVDISWPASPTGFTLQSTASLNPPAAWTPVNSPVVVNTNTSRNIVSVPADNSSEFFRLQRP